MAHHSSLGSRLPPTPFLSLSFSPLNIPVSIHFLRISSHLSSLSFSLPVSHPLAAPAHRLLTSPPVFYSLFSCPLHLPHSPPNTIYLCLSSCLSLSLSHSASFFILSSFPLSPGTGVSLQVLQGTQHRVIEAAASPGPAPPLLAKRGAAEGQQH